MYSHNSLIQRASIDPDTDLFEKLSSPKTMLVGNCSKRTLALHRGLPFKKIEQEEEFVSYDESINQNLQKTENEEENCIISCLNFERKDLCEPTLSASGKSCEKNKIKFSLQSSVFVKADVSAEWIRLKCFDSTMVDGSNGAIFFAGGPIQSSAFSIMPQDTKINQYVVVAVSNVLYKNNSCNNISSMDGIIQFWNLGPLYERKTLNQLPSMELALYHNNGIVTQMKWCPADCYDRSPATSHLPKLGLLAALSSDSSVYIYNVPQPDFMPKSKPSFPIYSTPPFIKLIPLSGGPSNITRMSAATCIEWNKNGDRIVAGYGNGSVCVWMIKFSSFTSNIAVKSNGDSYVVQPYLFFQASGACIESLSFAPFSDHRWLVVSSIDKMLRFFDLEDTSMPLHAVKQGLENTCIWADEFCGVYSSPTLDTMNRLSLSGIDVCAEITEKLIQKGVSGLFDASTHVAVSGDKSFHAIADMAGTVTVNLLQKCGEPLKTSYLTYMIFETEIMTLDSVENQKPKNLEDKIIISGNTIRSDITSVNEIQGTFYTRIKKDYSSSSSGFCSPKQRKTIEIKTPLYFDDNEVNILDSPLGSSTLNDSKDINNNEIKAILNESNSNEETNDEMMKCSKFSDDLMHDLLMVKISIQSKSSSNIFQFKIGNNSAYCDSKVARYSSAGASIISSAASDYTGDTIIYPLEEYFCDTSHTNALNSIKSNELYKSFDLTEKGNTLHYKATYEMNGKPASKTELFKGKLPHQEIKSENSHPGDNDLTICDRDDRQLSARAFKQSYAVSDFSGDTIIHSYQSQDCIETGANYLAMENPFASSQSLCKNQKEDTFQETLLDEVMLAENCSSSHSEYETDFATKSCTSSDKNRSFCSKELLISDFHHLHSENVCDKSAETQSPKNVRNPQELSYENLIANFGVIYKNNLEKPAHQMEKQKNDIYVKHNPLSVIKTVSWNPNEGCGSWLFVGGYSGIGRLVFIPDYLPDINEMTPITQKKKRLKVS